MSMTWKDPPLIHHTMHTDADGVKHHVGLDLDRHRTPDEVMRLSTVVLGNLTESSYGAGPASLTGIGLGETPEMDALVRFLEQPSGKPVIERAMYVYLRSFSYKAVEGLLSMMRNVRGLNISHVCGDEVDISVDISGLGEVQRLAVCDAKVRGFCAPCFSKRLETVRLYDVDIVDWPKDVACLKRCLEKNDTERSIKDFVVRSLDYMWAGLRTEKLFEEIKELRLGKVTWSMMEWVFSNSFYLKGTRLCVDLDCKDRTLFLFSRCLVNEIARRHDLETDFRNMHHALWDNEPAVGLPQNNDGTVNVTVYSSNGTSTNMGYADVHRYRIVDYIAALSGLRIDKEHDADRRARRASWDASMSVDLSRNAAEEHGADRRARRASLGV